VRVLDLFSGIGGFSLGLERAGMRTVAFCESDPDCRGVLQRRWPSVNIYHDVRQVGRIECDLVAGGFPCQPFSTAARGRNNVEDLWPEMLRVVNECRPRWVLAENVPGLGLAGVDRVCADLEDAGYTCWPLDIDTAPPGRQRERRRFLFVAYANGEGEPRRAFDEEMASLPDLSRRYRPDDPAPVGMDDGLPGRMDRLRMLGNAVSPWIIEIIGREIVRIELRRVMTVAGDREAPAANAALGVTAGETAIPYRKGNE
jgi:DNA (cytosine-5)-methyltransferase 1